MTVGQELLDVPFPEMVYKLAEGIANAQTQLDRNSIEIARALASEENEIEVVPAITRHIDENGEVTFETADPVSMSLLQVGLNPTFYEFSETEVEVKMDIRTTSEESTRVGVKAGARVGFGPWAASIKIDVEHNRKFGKTVEGTSRLYTKMTPVPPPTFLLPEVETIDERVPTEPEGPTPP